VSFIVKAANIIYNVLQKLIATSKMAYIFRPCAVSTIETSLSVTFEMLHFFRRDPPMCFPVEVIFWPLSRTDFPPLKQRFILVN